MRAVHARARARARARAHYRNAGELNVIWIGRISNYLNWFDMNCGQEICPFSDLPAEMPLLLPNYQLARGVCPRITASVSVSCDVCFDGRNRLAFRGLCSSTDRTMPFLTEFYGFSLVAKTEIQDSSLLGWISRCNRDRDIRKIRKISSFSRGRDAAPTA